MSESFAAISFIPNGPAPDIAWIHARISANYELILKECTYSKNKYNTYKSPNLEIPIVTMGECDDSFLYESNVGKKLFASSIDIKNIRSQELQPELLSGLSHKGRGVSFFCFAEDAVKFKRQINDAAIVYLKAKINEEKEKLAAMENGLKKLLL